MDTLTPSAAGMARLTWLIKLRWFALAGVSVAAAVGAAGIVPGVNLGVVALAVGLGVTTNVYLGWRWREQGDTDDTHVGQALLDTGALTLVLWAAGGAACPFLSFYIFPMLLAALLAGRRALAPTAVATAAGLAFQFAADEFAWLRVGRWDPPPFWAELLNVTAVMFTVGMAAYFAVRFTEALRRQIQARREADIILQVAFEGLRAGLEVVDHGEVLWQNHEATRLLGPRAGLPFTCPGRTGALCSAGGPECDVLGRATHCTFKRDGSEKVYELLAFPLLRAGRFMALYVERTAEILAQRKLLLTDRLASLGRTVQGVAHELNTPLATIQTLGRDVLDALEGAEMPDSVRDDLRESADMVVAEVQRCRRITHALLGRVDQLGARSGHATLSEALDRAVAVVCTYERDRLAVTGACGQTFPLDPLVQIFVNLLQNARDADPDGQLTARIDVGSEQIVVTLDDHGPGIAPEAMAHLFEPFFTTKPPGTGTGLGLYTSYALAQSLGGTLGLKTRAEGGTRATLTLPISAPSTPADAAP